MRSRTIALGFLVALPLVGVAASWTARDPIGAVRDIRRLGLALRGSPVDTPQHIQLQRSWWDCGPAALRNLLRLAGGRPPGLDSLIRLTGATHRGTTLGALAAAAGTLGYRATLFRASPVHFDRTPLPIIAWLDRTHFVVLAGRDDRGGFVVIDPELGRYRIGPRALRRRWSGPGLRVTPAD